MSPTFSVVSALKNWFTFRRFAPGRRPHRAVKKSPFYRLPLRLEQLESRSVPTTITRTSSDIFYANFAPNSGPALTSHYVAYQITNTDGVDYPDVWATIGNFTGGVVTLGAHADDAINLGPLANGETKTAFFYLRTTVSSGFPAQTHTVSVFNGPPTSGSLLAGGNFSLIPPDRPPRQTSSNKVNSVVISPSTPTIGGTFTITVTGETGTIGSARVFDLTPAAYTSWRADTFQLTGTTVTLSGGNTGTFTDTLLIPPGSLATANTNYTAVYTFRVVGTTPTPEPVSPVAYIFSGNRADHTDTGNFANLPPVQPPVNATTLGKTVAFSGPNTVTYTLTLTNSSAADVSLDRIVDNLPSTPAAVTYIADTALFNGTPVAETDISGQTLTFTDLFIVPAGSSRSLVFQATFPDVSGTYTNSAVGFVGDTQIDTTLDTTDNAPATAIFTVPALSTIPRPGAIVLGPNPAILTDTARLLEGNAPTGTITFDLFKGGTLVHTETVTVNGNGPYTTPVGFTLPTTGVAAGVYQWNATYSGDATNAPVSDIGSLNEEVVVTQASPTFTTIPALVAVGGTLQDSAVLAGGYHPTGTIAFTLVNPSGVAVHTESVPVSGNGTYGTTVGFVANAPGTWQWIATYSGDPNNFLVGPVDEPFAVAEPGVPTLTTTPGPGTTVPLNGSNPVTLTDTALLEGGIAPTGMIIFDLLRGGILVHSEQVTVNGDGTYTTPTGFTLPADGSTVTGTYQWNVSYTGDASNLSISVVDDPTERVRVDPARPTVKTAANPSGTIPLNSTPETLTDSADLESGFHPTGDLTFTLDFNDGTTTTTVYTDTVTVNGNGPYDTSAGDHPGGFTLSTDGRTVTGTYTWHVHYTGDGNNTAAADQGDAHEQVTIGPATPTVETLASDSAITLNSTVPTLNDVATLSGGFFPGGSITFVLEFDDGTTTTTVYTDTVPVSGNGPYNTTTGDNPGGFTLPTDGRRVTGTYTWRAHYSGDGNNNPADDGGGFTEQTVVHQAAPAVVTTADPSGTIQLGPTPPTLTDSAVLSGGYFPEGGTLTFKLFFNDGSDQTEVYTNNVTVSGNGTYDTGMGDNPGGFTLPTTGTVVGTYGWFVQFSGDDNNAAADDQGGPAEQAVVSPARPALVTAASPAAVILPTPVPTVLTDSAVLSGGFNPTGSIVFTLTGPNGFVFTQTVPVSGDGTYTVSTTLPTSGVTAGTAYTWSVAYSGDGNNEGATDQGGPDERTRIFNSILAISIITTTADPTTATPGTTLQDSADLTGGFAPTGTITFTLYAPGVDPTVGPAAHTETVVVTGNGTYHTAVGFVTDATGTWHWVATYSGDLINDSASSGPLDEPVTIAPQVADLAVAKTVDNPTPSVGDLVTFTFVLNNNGPDPATDVVVSDPFPPGLKFVAVASIDQGVYDPGTGLWRVGTLPVGATITLRITVLVAAVGTVDNEAVAGGDEFDPVLSNNRSTADLTIPTPEPSKRDLLGSTPPVQVDSLPARVEDLEVNGSGVPGRIAVGAGAGDPPLVRVFDQATGAERFRFYAYDPSFTGGVSVAVADVNGDGVDDIITGPGPGGGPHVEVFSGRDGSLLLSFFAYDPSFAGGVAVAAADVNGDGFADIITGAGPGGGPQVGVFDGRTGAVMTSFFAYDPGFRGGVNVAAGDVNGDGVPDVVTGAGAGGGPRVEAFDVRTGAELLSFFAYDPTFLGGVFVGVTGPAGGRADVVTGPGPGGGPVVERFDGRTGTPLAGVLVPGLSGTGGARVAGSDLTGSGARDILVGAGPGQDARLVVYDDPGAAPVDDVLALDSNYQGGLSVAGSR
jgi:uncharacterized repeat protein (TIGR01451 family)